MGGLKRLEYRGYDSAGVAIVGPDGALVSHKRAGKLSILADDLTARPLTAGQTGIAHTGGQLTAPPLTSTPIHTSPMVGSSP
jgi:glucosamine--fructose-6-phosphate aminotransferase (isomerizing)